MAQATDSPNTNRISFVSAGAVRAHRAAPLPATTFPRHRNRPAGVYSNETARLCFANLRDAIGGMEPPPYIGLAAGPADIDAVATHAKEVLGAVSGYIKALVGDTAYRAGCRIHDETGLLSDAAANIVGELKKSAESLRLDEVRP